MALADQYLALAEDCLQWATQAPSDDLHRAYCDLAQQWLDAASRLEGPLAHRLPRIFVSKPLS